MKSLISIWKHSLFGLIVIVFCVVATPVAQAKTISNNYQYIDESRLEFFKNLYYRQNEYDYYILASDTVSSGYNSYYDYYLCLTNDVLDTSDSLNLSSNCGKMYRYYRSNDAYVLEEYVDSELIINDSMYYTSSWDDYNFWNSLLPSVIGILTVSFVWLFTWLFYKIFVIRGQS